MKNGKSNKGKRRNPRHQRDNRDRKPTFTDEDIVSKEELESGNNLISLPELRTKLISELQTTAESMNIVNLARARRQDITFSILKAHAAEDRPIFGEGVLEILQDGFGFLRSSDSSYLAGPDDVYVSPN